MNAFRTLLSLAPVAVLAAGCASGPPDPARRVFLIGIDGATWDVMDPLLEAGRLPHLASLVEEGVRAPLRSMVPSRSPALWTTVVTGKDFDEHGINDFTQVVREDGVKSAKVMHMTSNMRRTKALWDILDEATRGSAFVGWWVSWPADTVNGYMVTSHVPLGQTGGKDRPTKGTLSKEDIGRQTWPPELFEELAPLIRTADSVTHDEARRFMDVSRFEMDKDIVEGFRWAYAADETYRAATRRVLEKAPDLELYGIYFNGIDVVEHRYWKYLDPTGYRAYPPAERPRFRAVIDRYYEYTDELVGEILAQRRPGDAFLILSDHGFRTGGHEDGPDGVLIAAGEHVAAGAHVDAPELLDVTPTVLALLGRPAGEDMGGRVWEEMFTPEWQDHWPRQRIPTHDTEEWSEQLPIASDVDAELMDRLRGLGYVQ